MLRLIVGVFLIHLNKYYYYEVHCLNDSGYNAHHFNRFSSSEKEQEEE